MKKVWCCILFSLTALTMMTQSALVAAATIDRVLAIVNEQIITLSELEERKQKLIKEMSRMVNPGELQDRISEVETQTLEMMIEEILMAQRADELGVKVDDDSIAEAIQNVMELNKLTSEEELERALQTEGLSLAEYKTIIAQQMKIFRVQNYEIKAKTRLIDGEVREYYDENRELFMQPRVFTLRQVLFLKPETGITEELRMKVRDVFSQLNAGADFCEMVSRHSDDTVTRESCGDLGEVQEKNLLPQFIEAIGDAKKDSLLPPFETENAFHIVSIVDISGGTPKEYEQVAAEIREFLFHDKFLKKRQEWINDLKKNSYIKIIGQEAPLNDFSERNK